MKKIIVLASGGVDSSVLIHVMARKGYDVTPVFIRQGLVWEKAEIYWLKKYLKFSRMKPLTILDVPVNDIYGKHWSLTGKKTPGYRSRDEEVYLPGRNVLLISKAAAFGALNKVFDIALGPLAGNPFPDSTRKFFDQMEKMLSLGLGGKFKIHTPFLKLKKQQALSLGGKFPLHLTFSCLKPRGLKPCGTCNKCREKEKLTAVMPRRVAHAE